jgi:hypothetical protein
LFTLDTFLIITSVGNKIGLLSATL